MVKKIARLVVAFVMVIAVLAVAAVVVLVHTRLLESQVNKAIDIYVESKYPLRINVDDVGGTVLSSVVARRVTVDYDDGETRYPLFTAREVELTYDLFSVIRHGMDFQSARLDRPVLTVRADADGRWLIPDFSSKKKAGGEGVEFLLDRLLIVDGFVRVPAGQGGSITVDDVGVDASIERDEGVVDASLVSLSGTWRERDLRARELSARVRAGRDTLDVERLRGRVNDMRFDVDARVITGADPSYAATVREAEVDVRTVSALFGKSLRGRLLLRGEVSGAGSRAEGSLWVDGDFFERTFDGLSLDFVFEDGVLAFPAFEGRIFDAPMEGSGFVDFAAKPNAYSADVDVEHLDVQNVAPACPFETDLSGAVSLQGSSFGEQMRLQIDAALGGSRVSDKRFDVLDGEIAVTLTDVAFGPNFRAAYKSSEALFEGRVGYSDSISIAGRASSADLRDFWNQTPVAEIGGRFSGEFRVAGEPSDPDLWVRARSDSLHVYGLLARDVVLAADVSRIMTRRAGRASVGFGRSVAYGQPLTYGRVGFSTGMTRFDFDTVSISSPLWRLDGEFWMDALSDSARLTVGRAAFVYRSNLISLDEPASFAVSQGVVSTDGVRLRSGAGRASLSGAIRPAGVVRAEWSIAGLDVSPWVAMAAPEPRVGGLLEAGGTIDGTMRYPRMDAAFRITDFAVGESDLGVMWGRASYRPMRLVVPELRVADGLAEVRAEGVIPLDLGLSTVPRRLLDEEVFVRIHAGGNGSRLVPVLVAPIESFSGGLTVDAQISGRPNALAFSGTGSLRDGRIKLTDVADPLVRANGDFVLRGGRVVIDSLRADVDYEYEKAGSFVHRLWAAVSGASEKGTGTVVVRGALDLSNPSRVVYDSVSVEARDFYVQYLPADVSVLADVDLTVSGPEPPTVRGRVVLSRAMYREPFVAPDSIQLEVSYGQAEDMWDYDLDVVLPGNCWVINDEATVEVEGELFVARDRGVLSVLGELRPIRGSYFLAATGTDFQVQGGTVVFDDVSSVDPALDLSATARVSDFDVDVHIGGRLSEPEVAFTGRSGDVALSQEDVLALLALGDTTGLEIGSRAGSYASALLFREVERTAVRTLGVEQFEVRYGEFAGDTSQQGLSLTLGKYISPRLFVRYTRPLSTTASGDLAAEYRLSRYWTAGADWDEKDLFHLSLRFRWEY